MNRPSEPFFEIPYYHDYISPTLANSLIADGRAVLGVPDLLEVGASAGLENKESFEFLINIYNTIKNDLRTVLHQRTLDRKFMDARVRACCQFNEDLNRDILDQDYKTIIGLEDSAGRVVFGPLSKNYARRGGQPIAPIPDFLKGAHVTLFGPPDSAKMAINAMNAYHRKLKNEPPIVAQLLEDSLDTPMWGADDEDSKTPLRSDLIDAAVNLTACFSGDLKVTDSESGKTYELAKDHLALPIKRFPGLALPSAFLFYKNSPIPLHLYDFALHVFKNWHNPQSLIFYVPKLENEEEAKYIHKMVFATEKLINKMHPSYREGTIRLMVVLENPRAILRTHEIIDALHPYFVGASLGWHDYLASTARLFKEDQHYRIPVKADPDIVIKYIKASHLLLADVVGSRGGIKVGGMYGILPTDSDLSSPSFQMTINGFIRDVIIQLKRDLTGFWVAHPDFVRLGLALVAGWRLYKGGNRRPLMQLVKSLLDKKYHKEILKYISAPDIKGLSTNDPNYVRSLIVADIKESDFIANNHPEEIRYNVFQSLQYLTDWLSGHGCVALPATVHGVAVRVMDDLATAERSRWEVWHELRHKRFSLALFLKIAHEELHFIQKDLSNEKKIVQVKWDETTEKWYPVAFKIMLQLMTSPEPPEFATELLMPFTIEKVRNAKDPWVKVCETDSFKYKLPEYVERFNYYFAACGSMAYADEMAQLTVQDLNLVSQRILYFSVKEIKEAAYFHGDIGENKQYLDPLAKSEQALVLTDSKTMREELRKWGALYKKKYGFKFLISAKDKSSSEILLIMKQRIKGSIAQEQKNAAQALAEIATKRMQVLRLNELFEKIEKLKTDCKIDSASLAIAQGDSIQTLSYGSYDCNTWYELASLSKSVASAYALDYFTSKKISIESSVNSILLKSKSKYRLVSKDNPAWADKVKIKHLLNHTALNMHYVKGVSMKQALPKISDLVNEVFVIGEPGQNFSYSGGGFLILEHLIEILEKKPIQVLTRKYLDKCGLNNISFQQKPHGRTSCADGYFDGGKKVPGGRYVFPAFAAGAMGTAQDVARFLQLLAKAYNNPYCRGPISHDIAVQMLFGQDRGSQKFMGAAMGLGIFVAEAGANKFVVHQGANEGFRALFIHCFSGPDLGKGFVILCNADNQGVLFIARAAQEILKELCVTGVDFKVFNSEFDFTNLKQEEIVNYGYKNLIFDALQPALPEAIADVGPVDSLAKFNLAVGAKISFVSNQRFARADNLLSPFDPVFDPELFGIQGKIMDSWETARHNEQGFDTLIFELKKASEISYLSISTKYHDGNHPEHIRILGKCVDDDKWVEMLTKHPLAGHSLLQIKLNVFKKLFQNIRVEIYPDGGLTRLGLYKSLPAEVSSKFKSLTSAKSVRFREEIPKTHKPMTIPYHSTFSEIKLNQLRCKKMKIDYASRAMGGLVLTASNEHYGPAIQVISPYPALNMFDGLESARSRQDNHFEEVNLQLGKEIAVGQIDFDFKFFVNNNPQFISIEGFVKNKWVELLGKTNVKPYAGNSCSVPIQNKTLFKKLRIRVYPDGGVNRIKVYSQ